jgi:uncharacterized delta-60 repeat protein
MTHARATRLVRAILACLVLALVTAIPAAAAPGDLDTGFGTGGSVFTAPGTSNTIYGVRVQSDGKIVAAGQSNSGFTSRIGVARYNADGSLDSSFGSSGTVVTTIGSGAIATDLVVQADGKIVVAGVATISSVTQFAVVRYNADGSLDSTFGTGGVVTTALGTSDTASSLALQADGKIVVVGKATVTNHVIALARYNTNGSLDTSFDTDGKVTTAIGTDDAGNSLVIDGTGKITVAGQATIGTTDEVALARYNSDGSLDTSFDSDGKVTTAVGTGAAAYILRLQPDGKLVAGGTANTGSNQFLVARYNTDGSLDSSFGSGGEALTSLGTSDAIIGLVLQPDGKLVAAGQAHVGTLDEFGLARYNSDGSLDSSFGSAGKVTTAVGAGDSAAIDLALQSDGSVVAAGTGYVGSTRNFALARYFGDPPDTSISSGPASSTTATDASFNFASTALGATFECQLDGGAWTACSSPQAYSGLGVGSHAFSVRSSYPVGNVDPSPANQSWTVTAPPPADPPPAVDPPTTKTPPPGKASIKAGDVSVGSDGVAPFVVTCGPTADCKGTVMLEMGTVTGRKASISRRSRPRVVGRARFSVKAGKKLTVKVKLAGSAKRMLRDKGSISATLKVTTVSAGKQLTTSKKIKIKAKAARRSRPRRVRR